MIDLSGHGETADEISAGRSRATFIVQDSKTFAGDLLSLSDRRVRWGIPGCARCGDLRHRSEFGIALCFPCLWLAIMSCYNWEGMRRRRVEDGIMTRHGVRIAFSRSEDRPP